MTRYCTATDVHMTVDTELDDDVLEELIEEESAEIDRRLGAQSATDVIIKKLCRLMVAYPILLKRPRSEELGERRVTMGNQLREWKAEIERIFKFYEAKGIVRSSDYQYIDEDTRYPED